jgi:hypothetical protein
MARAYEKQQGGDYLAVNPHGRLAGVTYEMKRGNEKGNEKRVTEVTPFA